MPVLLDDFVRKSLIDECATCALHGRRSTPVLDEVETGWNMDMGPVFTILFTDQGYSLDPNTPAFKDDEFVQLTDLSAIIYWPPLSCGSIRPLQGNKLDADGREWAYEDIYIHLTIVIFICY